jgi:EAL domain-containing protein (putative c-di-GMP-specific phosphodiesterase class I)
VSAQAGKRLEPADALLGRGWVDPRRDRTLTLSINLSGRRLQHPEVVADVADALRGSGLPPSSLVLEMTESVLMDDNERVLTILRQTTSAPATPRSATSTGSRWTS